MTYTAKAREIINRHDENDASGSIELVDLITQAQGRDDQG